MAGNGALRWILLAVCISIGGLGYAASKRFGWVTDLQPEAETMQVGELVMSTQGREIVGAPLQRGAFVEVEAQRITVKPQRLPLADRVSQFSAPGPGHLGRVGFSHLRHFNALGEGQCTTCHTTEGELVWRRAEDLAGAPGSEAHSSTSLGRFCQTCHDGVTRLSQVGVRRYRPERVVFTAMKTALATSCLRCHVPQEHGDDFTLGHGEVAKRGGKAACQTCHSQDWTPEDRQAQADFLATEPAWLAFPEATGPALVAGPNNFCVYCHRIDATWQEQ